MIRKLTIIFIFFASFFCSCAKSDQPGIPDLIGNGVGEIYVYFGYFEKLKSNIGITIENNDDLEIKITDENEKLFEENRHSILLKSKIQRQDLSDLISSILSFSISDLFNQKLDENVYERHNPYFEIIVYSKTGSKFSLGFTKLFDNEKTLNMKIENIKNICMRILEKIT